MISKNFFRYFLGFRYFVSRKLPVINLSISTSCLLLQCKSQFWDKPQLKCLN